MARKRRPWIVKKSNAGRGNIHIAVDLYRRSAGIGSTIDIRTMGGFAAEYDPRIIVPPIGSVGSLEWTAFIHQFNPWRRSVLNKAASREELWQYGCIPYQLNPVKGEKYTYMIVTTADVLINGISFGKLLSQFSTSEDHEVRYIHSARPETLKKFSKDIQFMDFQAGSIQDLLTYLLKKYSEYKQSTSKLYNEMRREDMTRPITDDFDSYPRPTIRPTSGRGRPPIGDRAMTSAERTRRHRERKRQGKETE